MGRGSVVARRQTKGDHEHEYAADHGDSTSPVSRGFPRRVTDSSGTDEAPDPEIRASSYVREGS
jgi:hypothetical protein